jgi:hypothetical protein
MGVFRSSFAVFSYPTFIMLSKHLTALVAVAATVAAHGYVNLLTIAGLNYTVGTNSVINR